MRCEFKTSFDRSYKKLSVDEQTAVDAAVKKLVAVYSASAKPSVGQGTKNLGKHYWECRLGLRLRLIYGVSDHLTFFLIGDHNDVQRFIGR